MRYNPTLLPQSNSTLKLSNNFLKTPMGLARYQSLQKWYSSFKPSRATLKNSNKNLRLMSNKTQVDNSYSSSKERITRSSKQQHSKSLQSHRLSKSNQLVTQWSLSVNSRLELRQLLKLIIHTRAVVDSIVEKRRPLFRASGKIKKLVATIKAFITTKSK